MGRVVNASAFGTVSFGCYHPAIASPIRASTANTFTMPVVSRPWGWYQTVSESPGILIKRIVVSPGQQISLQRHRMRAEHWVVVRGTAQATVGERVLDLEVGQHVDIAIGEVHRLANRTTVPMEIVEVQLGKQLEEADIERLQDDYGRN